VPSLTKGRHNNNNNNNNNNTTNNNNNKAKCIPGGTLRVLAGKKFENLSILANFDHFGQLLPIVAYFRYIL
jgi:hypothetical protein